MNIQIAGSDCIMCAERIMIEKEGTYCYRCDTPLCRECAQPDCICPVCRKAWDDPASHYYFSEFCPGCMQKNHNHEYCGHCDSPTRWPDKSSYDQFFVAHHAWVRRSPLVGSLMAAGGLLVIASPFLIAALGISIGIGIFFLYGLIFVGIPIVANGLARIIKGNRRSGFR